MTNGRQDGNQVAVAANPVAGDRGQGNCGALFHAAIDLARTAGYGLIPLTIDKPRSEAHRFYQRLGFVEPRGHEAAA